MNCKNCGNELTKKQKSLCSKKCKNEWQAKQPKIKSDETIQFRCKITGDLFDFGTKRSGYLKKYSKNTLKKEYDESDWEIVDKVIVEIPKWNCPHCEESFKCSGIDAGGWIGNHLLNVHGFSKIDHVNQFPQDSVLWPNRLQKAKRQEFINSNEENQVKCLECGKSFMKISNTHLTEKHNGMTLSEYRLKYPNAQIESQELKNRYI